jgi:hypothetical protein
LRSIYQSDYLSFAYRNLEFNSGRLVIVGAGLEDSDHHIVSAVNNSNVTEVAIGLYPNLSASIPDLKAHYRRCFPSKGLHFFDSSTHPICAPSLNVVE